MEVKEPKAKVCGFLPFSIYLLFTPLVAHLLSYLALVFLSLTFISRLSLAACLGEVVVAQLRLRTRTTCKQIENAINSSSSMARGEENLFRVILFSFFLLSLSRSLNLLLHLHHFFLDPPLLPVKSILKKAPSEAGCSPSS